MSLRVYLSTYMSHICHMSLISRVILLLHSLSEVTQLSCILWWFVWLLYLPNEAKLANYKIIQFSTPQIFQTTKLVWPSGRGLHVSLSSLPLEEVTVDSNIIMIWIYPWATAAASEWIWYWMLTTSFGMSVFVLSPSLCFL